MTTTLCLLKDRRVVDEVSLSFRPIYVGRDPTSDLVVPTLGEDFSPLRVEQKHGSVFYYQHGGCSEASAATVVPLNVEVPLTASYALLRLERGRSAVGAKPETRRKPPAIGDLPGLVLRVVKPATRRVYRMLRTSITLGSDEENGICLRGKGVAARHCRIDPVDGGWVLRDLGSPGGCWLNGVRIYSARLACGQCWQLGEVVGQVEELNASRRERATSGMLPPYMAESAARLQRFVDVSAPLLLRGETGVGKEVLARQLHARSRRAGAPFVAINSGALTASLVESELFGHEQGAFTGATAKHCGAFEAAQGGTLFLDEIGELPLSMQARLLRALDGQRIRRVGGTVEFRVDTKVICATHRALEEAIEAGQFRADLYYRINQLVEVIPPLRKRPEDIEWLSRAFLTDLKATVGPKQLSKRGLARLKRHPWPGNARELKSVMLRAGLMHAAEEIGEQDIEAALKTKT